MRVNINSLDLCENLSLDQKQRNFLTLTIWVSSFIECLIFEQKNENYYSITLDEHNNSRRHPWHRLGFPISRTRFFHRFLVAGERVKSASISFSPSNFPILTAATRTKKKIVKNFSISRVESLSEWAVKLSSFYSRLQTAFAVIRNGRMDRWRALNATRM